MRKTTLLLLLLLIISAALPASAVAPEYFEAIASLQQQYGYYEDWPLAQKTELLLLMEEYQVGSDPDSIQTILDDSATNEVPETAIDAYIVAAYGIDGRSDVITLSRILTVEKGLLETWTAEDKAWYSQMLITYDLIGGDSYVYLLPSDTDISPEAAVSIAQEALTLQYDLTDAYWDEATVVWFYQVHIQDYGTGDPYYVIQFNPSSTDQVSYYCMIANDGTVMPENEFDTVEETDGEFDDQEAVQLYQEYMQAHPEIPADASFGLWSLEGKQYFSEVIRPVVLQNYAEHVNQTYTQTYLLAAAQFIYGLPDDQGISQEQALQIAQAALLDDFGVQEEYLVYYDTICVFYDITDPDLPLWKITLTAVAHYTTLRGVIDNPRTVFKVEMDARTAAILTETSFDPGDNDGSVEFQSLFY